MGSDYWMPKGKKGDKIIIIFNMLLSLQYNFEQTYVRLFYEWSIPWIFEGIFRSIWYEQIFPLLYRFIKNNEVCTVLQIWYRANIVHY